MKDAAAFRVLALLGRLESHMMSSTHWLKAVIPVGSGRGRKLVSRFRRRFSIGFTFFNLLEDLGLGFFRQILGNLSQLIRLLPKVPHFSFNWLKIPLNSSLNKVLLISNSVLS
jgi:hypothetical protein